MIWCRFLWVDLGLFSIISSSWECLGVIVVEAHATYRLARYDMI